MSLAAFFQTTLQSSAVVSPLLEIETIRQNGSDTTIFLDRIDIVDGQNNEIVGAVKNNSFEYPVTADNYTYGIMPDDWTHASGNYYGLLHPGSAFNNPNNLFGSQALFLQHDNLITQQLHLAPGTYKVRLYAANRASGTGDMLLVVRVNGLEIARVVPTTGYDTLVSQLFTI